MREKPAARCEECGDLNTHEFRGADDLVHAVQTAAAEIDRGVLRRVEARDLSDAEREALDSALASDALPGALRYRFQCTVCGDRFELVADMSEGSGKWTREESKTAKEVPQ